MDLKGKLKMLSRSSRQAVTRDTKELVKHNNDTRI
jgi:hypothetical protein